MQTCDSKMDSHSQTHMSRHTPTNHLDGFQRKVLTGLILHSNALGSRGLGRMDGQGDGQPSNRVWSTTIVLLPDTHTNAHMYKHTHRTLLLSIFPELSSPLPHQTIHVHTPAVGGRRCCSRPHGRWVQLSFRWDKQDMRNQTITSSSKSI